MSFIDDYVAFTERQETTERIHRWVAISVVAAALERRVWLNRGHYTLFPNLYTFIIGPSGIVKKSTSTAIGVNLLRSLDGFQIMSDRLTAASLIEQLEGALKPFKWKERTIKQSPMFAYGSELNVFLSEVYGSISELLTTFYDCVPHDSEKPWTYATKLGGTTRIYGPCLNFLGASTPAWLVRSLPPTELEGGFASRVIFVHENESRRAIAWPDAENEDEAQSARERFLVSQLRRIYELSGPVRVDPKLRVLGQAWYEHHQRVAKPDTRFTGYHARKFDTLLKLAIILSAAESSELLITPAHFEHAIALLNDVEPRMMEAFGSYGENPNAPIIERVWKQITSDRSNKMTFSSLSRVFRRDAGLQRLTEVLTHLQAMGRLRRTTTNQDMLFEAIEPEKPL